ncbi:MAG: undecaprenyl-diphosphate phosphatase [Candidatus Magasanikbacteria bacterium]|nr:undecaprenyl-diphosphate phosphatase [Candidatus Magasanikbacteria bacterium]
MTYLHALILSIVEGITEFLPISSTGHMVLVAHFLRIDQTEFVKTFEIFIQLGAILAAIVLYARRILTNWKLFKQLVIAFIPTGIIGLTVYKLVKQFLLGNAIVTTIALLIGGLVLIAFDLLWREPRHATTIEKITIPQSISIGFFQTLAMIPGVSRSAATIIGGSLAGLSREAAVEFSFMLAIPTMLAASGLDLIKSSHHFSSSEFQILTVGFFGAFLSALIVIKIFIGLLSRRTFLWFGLYRVILALAILGFGLLK